MLMREDACCDGELYAVWLAETYESPELAEQVGGIIADGGYTTPRGFVAGLAGIAPIDLAEFKAGNFPFETDDCRWLEHCNHRYPGSGEPTETADERNGARVTWPGL